MKRVNGVGDVTVFGTKIILSESGWILIKWLLMGWYLVTLVQSLMSKTLKLPGKMGEQGKQSFEYTLKYKGRLTSTAEFENIVLKGNIGGQILRLKDVAKIELGAQDYSGNTFTDGQAAIGVAVAQTAGSNARSYQWLCGRIRQRFNIFP